MITHRWKKLLVAPSLLGHDAFADWFRWGDDDGPAIPLVVWVGAPTRIAEYAARRRSRPAAVVAEFEKAFALRPLPAVDLLVVPCPLPIEERRDRALEDFRSHFLHELLPACPSSHPERISFIGLSGGSRYAAWLQFEFKASRGLVTLAGSGMAGALAASARKRTRGCRFVSLSNPGHPMAAESARFGEALRAAEVDLSTAECGVHDDLSGLTADGSLAKGFRAALDALGGPEDAD